MNVPEAREAFTASWGALERRALAAMKAETARHERIIRDAFEIPDAGCRAVALSPPSASGRSIIEIHEPTDLLSRLFLGRRRCYCGRSR